MKKTKFIALFIIGILCLSTIKTSADDNMLDYHMSKFSAYLENNSNSKNGVDTVVENYYKNPENKKIAESAMKQQQNNDYNVYKVIKMNNSDVTLYNNGTFSIDTITEKQEKMNTFGDSFKTVTNNWTWKTILGNYIVTHKFKAKFGYNKKKAWIVPRSAVGNSYGHYIFEVQSTAIDGWDTAAHSRTARLYTVVCQNFNGMRLNYAHSDTRVGVTKNGNTYTSHRVGGGI